MQKFFGNNQAKVDLERKAMSALWAMHLTPIDRRLSNSIIIPKKTTSTSSENLKLVYISMYFKQDQLAGTFLGYAAGKVQLMYLS